MIRYTSNITAFLVFAALLSCSRSEKGTECQPLYQDVPFRQEYAVKYNLPETKENILLRKVVSDRNGVIQVLSSNGLLKVFDGAFLYPGLLVHDKTYRPIAGKTVTGITLFRNQFVYVDERSVLSNAWGGSLFVKHTLPAAKVLEGGSHFDFLISDGNSLQYLNDSTIQWTGRVRGRVIDIAYDGKRNFFFVLTRESVYVFSPSQHSLTPFLDGDDYTCQALARDNDTLIVGTTDGCLIVDVETGQLQGAPVQKLPWTEITAVQEIDGQVWVGTSRGAFKINPDSSFNYYSSRRWLPSDQVVDIQSGPDYSVLVLCDKGLARIDSREMTLYEKAMYYEQQVRSRHIRHGFNAALGYMTDGSLATGSLEDSDNDGLWTSMYLAAEVFRYSVTGSENALKNIRESMEAMERLYTINGVRGFPSRSFERRGYKYEDKPWRRADHPEWDWKSTTSSDEAIGHIFAFGVMAELIDDPDLRTRAITLVDSLMQHVLDNNLYLVDWNGEPTAWGKWNPEYVNARPVMVGDRKLNSSNIIAMLQTAYHFAGREIYKKKALELMTEHGYLENLMRPMEQITRAPGDSDPLSIMLSESWNHSDDEMYFLGYWGLYRYAFDDSLKTKYKAAIIDHWQAERPEKEGLWNIFTVLTGTQEFDLNEAVWYLQRYPLDLIHWTVQNSHRKDIEFLEPNFRQQTIRDVLPPDELPVNRHNANRFQLDGGDRGTSEYSAGDIWLLPYWMGRYLGVISKPAEK